MTAKIRLAAIIGGFLLIIMAILIYNSSYVASIAMLALLVVSIKTIIKIKK